jgi:leucyl aminopeptidase
MKLKVTTNLESEGLQGWILPFFESELEGPGFDYDKALGGIIGEVLHSKEFEAKTGKTFFLRPLHGKPVARVVLVGLGKRADATLDRVHRAYAAAARQLREAGCHRAGATMPAAFGHSAERVAQTVGEALVMGMHEFNKYKSPQEPHRRLTTFFLQVPESSVAETERGLERGRTIAEAVNFCRDLANEPPGVATPAYVAGVALAMAGGKLSCRVLSETDMAQLGMNAILSVGQGSANPPRMVALEYRGGAASDPFYAVVGKGVTFDSGGLSIKPAGSMEDMKYDKCGACAVLGVLKAVAALELPLNVVGVAGLAENLPGGTAYRPGDIIRASNGKTIEVLNTDAEGRVLLADTLHFAASYKPKVIVDLATLTGACVVALGDIASGVLGNDDQLIGELISFGEQCGERLWQLPLWPEYDEKVKSEVADVKNLGERAGGIGLAGCIAGASFLKAFVPSEVSWAHLDIAGTAWDGKKRPHRSPGATGIGVRLLVEWLASREVRKNGKKKRSSKA